MRHRLFICGILLLLLSPSSVLADTIFNFNFNSVVVHGQPGLPYGGSGQFDAVATSTPGTFAIVGVTGTVSGSPLGTETITSFSGDNGNQQGTLSVNNGSVSLVQGVIFSFKDGTVELDAGNFTQFNLNTGYLAYLNYYVNPALYASEVASVNLTITEAPPSIAATPEPGTFVLLGTGLVGMVSVARRNLIGREALG